MDAAMREVWGSGWMHNRMRVVAASFLVKNLLLPWQVRCGMWGGAVWGGCGVAWRGAGRTQTQDHCSLCAPSPHLIGPTPPPPILRHPPACPPPPPLPAAVGPEALLGRAAGRRPRVRRAWLAVCGRVHVRCACGAAAAVRRRCVRCAVRRGQGQGALWVGRLREERSFLLPIESW